MRDEDYILDLSSLKPQGDVQAEGVQGEDGSQPAKAALQGGVGDAGQAEKVAGEAMQGRKWIAMKWKCCGAYSRVYKNRAGDAYEGRCPKCMRPIKVGIGPGGTSDRFFETH